MTLADDPPSVETLVAGDITGQTAWQLGYVICAETSGTSSTNLPSTLVTLPQRIQRPYSNIV